MFTTLDPGALSFTAPLDDLLELARRSGFAAVDLPFPELLQVAEATSVQELQDRFRSAGVRPGGWKLPVDFKSSEDSYRTGLAALPRHASLAQQLGSPWCFTWILPYSDELDYGANMERHVALLRPVAQVLAEYGCQLGLEFVGPSTMRSGHTYPFIHTMAEVLELSQRIGTGNVGLLLDCWHWYTSHATLDDLAQLRGAQVVYVHVNDAPVGRGIDEQIDTERLLPGESGVIDIAGFLQGLQAMDYAGPVAVEPFNAAVRALPPAERAQRAGQSLAKIWKLAGLFA
jgi:sugar phosphate isomerase/epimerase